ncbi:LOW QUALITY PROTEIN: uncharacterized protein EMH_0088830 [Eimeria mitis]|uniref:Uncharacterized protein n=1 Tax=Eimeria mitis TaxID=44415 RepID=U6KEZ6_9EIME|nr:LOW QUALITY PROTEIN: uncharacterized protein EMH_0088830 [Eimeria mitis]CDJ36519.1 hypothetical protein EMH_0088830 [Eimeria mitis]
MPLRSLASRLRSALTPLVAERLKEQEEKVQKLLAYAERQDVVSKERRLLETLRHCNPVAARDRTLVSATLGLLPQSRPGSFICGVSLVCFKASVYGEAAALLADPGQFFKTPEDICRLITAIQRLRWRLAVRIIMHVHPTLLWLQRRAYLMRKINHACTPDSTMASAESLFDEENQGSSSHCSSQDTSTEKAYSDAPKGKGPASDFNSPWYKSIGAYNAAAGPTNLAQVPSGAVGSRNSKGSFVPATSKREEHAFENT